MGNHYINLKVSNFWLLTILLGTFLISSLPSDVAAQSVKMSKKECRKQLKKFIKKTAFKTDKKTKKNARRHCKNGDISLAKRTILASKNSSIIENLTVEQCLRKIEIIAHKKRIKPDSDAYGKALRYCQTGKPDMAMRIIHSSNSTSALEEDQCMRKVEGTAMKMGIKLVREDLLSALRYCKKGDTKSAINIIKKSR